MNAFDFIILALAGVAIAAFGVMWFFADGMDPTGQKSGLGGCLTVIGGLGMFGTMVWLAIRHL